MVTSSDYKKIAGVWEPRLGATVRIVILRDNILKPIFWIQAQNDGSIYLGVRDPGAEHGKYGSSRSVSGKLRIDYSEGDEIQQDELLKNSKISFHASGTIHAAGERSFRNELRKIENREFLCHFLPKNIEEFDPIEQPRKYDICLEYPINEDAPLLCNVYVAPLSEEIPPAIVAEAKYQFSVLLHYFGLKDVGDIEVQLNFHHGPEGRWPPSSYIVWPTNKDRDCQNAL